MEKEKNKSDSEGLYNEYKSLMDNGEECTPLVLTYETLMDKLNEDDYKMCDGFMGLIMIKSENNSDLLVHVLNILSTKKEKLLNWDSFVEYCASSFAFTLGEEKAKQLIKVIL